MTKQELLSIFSSFTREDWNAFQKIQQDIFAPTPEELEQQRIEQEQIKQNIITQKLSAIGYSYPETVTKEFVLDMMNAINAQQFVGSDISGWIDNQVLLFGDLKTAFDDLVFTRL